jgi:hypothetical protein
MKRAAALPDACRVTSQYRSRDGFVYELESDGTVLTVHISRGAALDDSGDWRVAVHNGRGADVFVVAESAPTGTEALRRVGRSWAEKAFELRLPRFDWDAIAKVLLAVRAI